MIDRHNVQWRVLGACTRNVGLIEVLSRIGFNEGCLDRDLRPAFRLIARGHRYTCAAISGADPSQAGQLVRRIYQATTALPGDYVVDLARILLEPEPVPLQQPSEPPQCVVAPPGVPQQPIADAPTGTAVKQSRAARARAFLKTHVLDRGRPIMARNLERMAKDEGILPLHETINHDNSFTRAKKLLGIRTFRTGFGAEGRAWWEKKPQPARRPVSNQPADTI